MTDHETDEIEVTEEMIEAAEEFYPREDWPEDKVYFLTKIFRAMCSASKQLRTASLSDEKRERA